ncbi:heavy metal translocating P-type ATPase [Halomonas sp. PAMB 3232]|uniref:heavy metal translocating P-type ATPase n=1 Tax=Halomonas sp. PAMB 3232 TaxID=3075221 RepID=UPI00289E02F4|nr:heavy metal translocating P-type ATPase [Halomonas sp. PAMB 3232]WNL38364.1 heavy metal translocating P-type ATPase [Halomonas sp. PAMB 3232]
MSAACYHCGAPVPAGASWTITLDGAAKPLCCPGCEAVAHAIVEGGLEGYYRYRTELSPRPADDRARAETWTAFDHPELQAQFVHPRERDVSATLAVENITCAACAWLIEHHLNALEGITGSAVNLTEHRLRVSWDPAILAPSHIFAELAAIGYEAMPFEPDRALARQKREARMSVRRLIVAAVGMMQVVMFSVPLYVAGPNELGDHFFALFHWLSLSLTTPVVAFSAWPFFRAAANALAHRRLTMEVPVALALMLAYGASVYAVFKGQGDVYFDSIAMFTFFLLLSRHIEARTRRAGGNALSHALPAAALRLEDDGAERVVPASLLKAGERVRVNPGATVPADGIIEQGESSLDESMLTGEFLPVTRRPGGRVIGGSQNVENALIVRVTHAGRESTINSVLDLTDRAFAHRPRLARIADTMAHRFVLRLLLVTLCVATAWLFIDPDRAFWVTLSVLVVTCPCALALAAPTALATGHAALYRRGVLITRADALEALAGVTRVVFDKTGTLTHGEMRLAATQTLGALSEPHARQIAAAIEAHSEHPIASAFRPFREPALSACDVVRHPNQGLGATLDGKRWRLGRAAFAAGDITPPGPGQWLLLSREGADGAYIPSAWFRLEDTLRDDAAETVARLQALGLDVELLSGDERAPVQALAQTLGITTWQARATPEEKLARIQALQTKGERVLMVGDGINDVPVLAGADVALAMNGATDLAQTRADALLLSPRLVRVVEALSLARATRRVMRQNIAWSVAYNGLALPLAALGLVPPWLAALGMSLSSLVVVGNALRLKHGARGRRQHLPAHHWEPA